MDGNELVTCCFTGLPLKYEEAVMLQVFPTLYHEESQQLFCHRDHLLERLHKSVPVHPDLLDNEE